MQKFYLKKDIMIVVGIKALSNEKVKSQCHCLDLSHKNQHINAKIEGLKQTQKQPPKSKISFMTHTSST